MSVIAAGHVLPFWTIEVAAACAVALLALVGVVSVLTWLIDRVAAWKVARSGCPRHRGDPHHLCPACWDAE